MYFNQIEVWKEICPDPNLLFKSKNVKSRKEITNTELINFRNKHLGKNLKLHYNNPIRIVRGVGQYLMDNNGRLYLDTVNNVAHVGHEIPDIVIAGQKQMALLNTNTRYLHEGINNLANNLLKTLPRKLSVCYFVNSGSEANELAIRMIKEVTGQNDIIVSQWGYHGNTNACVDISSYKFDRKGGKGAPKNTHVIPIPDSYRGKYRGRNTGNHYSKEVKKCIDKIHYKNRGVGGLIIEPIISCGGQVELPKGFLKSSYNYIRKAGGVCVSDEVQVGFGRLGKSYWGFELHDVIPDIITIGKPFGNGHPIGAVVCSEEIANKFANGMEFFNTFGGNPVSCSIATEVLSFIERNNLQKNALLTGGYLKKELIKLEKKYSENMIVVNTFLSSLDQKFLVTADMNERHRLMKIREVDFTPLVIQERKIQDEKVFEIESRYVIVNIWDDEKIDGDTLSINFNGKWILKDYHLIKEKKT